jgi:hypothetical protein
MLRLFLTFVFFQQRIMGFDEHLAENIRLGSEERFNERAFCFENNYLES